MNKRNWFAAFGIDIKYRDVIRRFFEGKSKLIIKYCEIFAELDNQPFVFLRARESLSVQYLLGGSETGPRGDASYGGR